MKKNRIGMYIAFLFILGFSFNLNVKGLDLNAYQGTSTSLPAGVGGCDDTWNAWCRYNNANHATVKVTLVYFDGTTRSIISSTIITNNDWTGSIVNAYSGHTDSSLPGRLSTGLSGKLESYLLNETVVEQYLSWMGVNKSNLKNPTEVGGTNGINSIGYRFLIEPMMSWRLHGKIKYFTSKEIASLGYNAISNPSLWDDISILMNTEFDDIGIRYLGSGTQQVIVISSPGSGYGYNIIDFLKGGTITPPVTQACNLKINNKLASCINTNTSNFGSIAETVTGNCNDEFSNVTNDGRLVKTEGTYCSMYCLETVSQIFPGNVAPAIGTGKNIVWPTVSTGIYPLSFKGYRTCKYHVKEDALKSAYNGAYNNLLSKSVIARNYYNLDKTCNTYKTDADQKEAILNSAKSVYDSAIKACEKLCVGECIVPCSSKVSSTDLNTAQTEYDKAKDKYNLCADYKDSYNKVVDVINAYNTCSASNYSSRGKELYNFMSDVSLSYNDPEYGGNFELVKESETVACTSGCTGTSVDTNPYVNYTSKFSSSITAVKNRTLIVTAEVNYKIKEGYYNFVDKLNNKSVNNLSELSTNKDDETNYINLGYSNLPISWNSKLGIDYDLNLRINNLGHNLGGGTGTFTSSLTNYDYTCKYEVTSASSSCICPEGTLNEGKDLYCMIYENNKGSDPFTCADATYVWCDSQIQYIAADKCARACSNDPSISLEGCIESGYSYSYCENLLCNGKEYRCPEDTKNKGMDISSCVLPMIARGNSESYSYEYCKNVTCPGGLKIIYRTIKLENPFPGKNISNIVAGFNKDVKGRYPGSNWNSLELVKSKIINNRGTSGSSIYQNKEPLYVFTLDTSTILAIRSYNEKQKDGYADFNLNCKKNNSTACVSSFVHNISYGITGGTCRNTSNSDGFYKCDD